MQLSSDLQNLLNQSFGVLESCLNDSTLGAEERAAIALQILQATRTSSPVQTNGKKEQTVEKRAIAQPTVATVQQPAPEPLSADWRRWIAENKLLDHSDESIITAMVQGGIDKQIAFQAVKNIASDPCFAAGARMAQLMRKYESILETNHKVAALAPHFTTVERRSDLSREEFLENYYTKSKPVILTDMMEDWSALSLWTPEYIKTKYGHVAVEIQANRNSDANFEINKTNLKRVVKLGEYVDMVLAGGETNDYYLTANNGALTRPELQGLLQDINMFPEFLNGADTHNKAFFWFGPAGTITPLHHDENNLIMAQVVGRKRWRIISPNQTPLMYNYCSVFSQVDGENPDYEKYPLYRQVNVIEAVVEPGEAIYIPVGWWHHVKSLDISFSVSFTNFVFPNGYNYKNPNIAGW
jgi:Cupin-like domain